MPLLHSNGGNLPTRSTILRIIGYTSSADGVFPTFDSLKASGTPGPILDALTHGTNRALTVGSLHAGDTLLTTAFKEQCSTIGWYKLLLGCRSGKWRKAYAAYVGRSCTMQQQTSWSSLLVTLLWKYTRSLWQYCNEIIHGSTAEASAKLQLIQL